MTFEQQVIAFALTRLPIVIGAGLLLSAAARQWRDKRGVASLLAVAAVALLTSQAAEAPIWEDGRGFPVTVTRWLNRQGFDLDVIRWAFAVELAAAAACGLAAVFLRRAPDA